MTKNITSKGSLWRIWDLHVHSPATYGGDYAVFQTNLKSAKADVIGINDYCTLEGYNRVMELGGVAGKTIFPVVEFRMHNIVANRKNQDPTKSGTKINFHLIFDNDPGLTVTINTWLNSLECYNDRGEVVQLGTTSDKSKLTFDIEKILEGLKKLNLFEKHCLLWLPYDEYGGIDDIDPHDNFFKLHLINRAHIIGSSTKKQIEFFKWRDKKYNEGQYKEWFEYPKPCIKGSDAHSIDYAFGHLMNGKSQPVDKFCWINGEPTFKGLKRIIIEPDRVFIGDEPDLLKRIRTNQTKFVKSIAIEKANDEVLDSIWFEDFAIDLNASLVAIIGNKGSGKSAITDIVALCGNTHQDASNFSFLTPKKFRKPKPYNLSEKFKATITWHDGTSVPKRLNEDPNTTLPQRVKYIPQNFLERLCANVDSEDFEKELKNIIFSHTPADKRLGKSSLDELINYLSGLVVEEIGHLLAEMSKINTELVDLESKDAEEFRRTVDNRLQLKNDELRVHQTIKPLQPPIQQGVEINQEVVNRLAEIRVEIKKLESEEAIQKNKKSSLSLKRAELSRANQHFKNLNDQLTKLTDSKNEFISILTKYEIKPKDVFSFKVSLKLIEEEISKADTEISAIDLLLDPTKPESITSKLAVLNKELKLKQEDLNKPAKEQQKYFDALREWEAQNAGIVGTAATEGSLKFLEHLSEYLKNQVKLDIESRVVQRKELLINLFKRKTDLIDIRKVLFQPVTQFINDFEDLKARYDVKLDVALELKAFPENFFAIVSQGRIGTFSGKEEGYKKLQELIERAHFDTAEGFLSFSDELMRNLKFDTRLPEPTSVDVVSQLRKGSDLKKLYDFVYGYEYLEPVYNLKLGNKTLQELSPGERGALLLIFYLILDNDDIPLIIDQPEENLDNESVYHILVHFIKKVKERRQIIIVTHNPNLAIVCDADQIIHMQIEKENRNAVHFKSGAIEDDIINQSAINVLEGTMAAFINRHKKYLG